MKIKKQITITPDEFNAAVCKCALKWKQENLKESSVIAKLVAKIQGQLLNLVFAELFEEAEDAQEEAVKKEGVRGLDVDVEVGDAEMAKELVKALTKLAAGKKAEIKIIKL